MPKSEQRMESIRLTSATYEDMRGIILTKFNDHFAVKEFLDDIHYEQTLDALEAEKEDLEDQLKECEMEKDNLEEENQELKQEVEEFKEQLRELYKLHEKLLEEGE